MRRKVIFQTLLTFRSVLKCTLVQALRLCTGRTAHRGSRCIALLLHDQRHWKGVRGQFHAPVALYPRERPGTHCTGDWVGPRAGLHRCGKSRPHRDSIPGPSSRSSQSLYRLSYRARTFGITGPTYLQLALFQPGDGRAQSV